MDDETKLYINDLKVSIHVERSRRDTYRNAIAAVQYGKYKDAAKILAASVEQDDSCERDRRAAHAALSLQVVAKKDVQRAWKLLHGLRNLADKMLRNYEAKLKEAEE